MQDKDPNTVSWLIYLGFAALSTWGAAVAHLRKVRMGRKFRWVELGLDLFCAPFIGVIAGFLCLGLSMPMPLAFALSGLAGHAGPRILGRMTNRILGDAA